MKRRTTIEQCSTIPVASEVVWRRVTTPAGINDELWPCLRMTVPRVLAGRPVEDLSGGERLGRSWLLLAGLLPFDFDDINVHAIDHGRRFHERSWMASMRLWEHERNLRPSAGGCTEVHDRVTMELRSPLAELPFARRLVASIVALLFRHRHRRLARWAKRRAT